MQGGIVAFFVERVGSGVSVAIIRSSLVRRRFGIR
jgi:hypothetical protein